jgi:(R,R)-butanediol dehydrogenase/meso-butanediol dehydrogenase/diacetyl reductase
MKAARFHARKDIRIEDIPEPELRAGAVKIDVAWCGICGTDLHEYLEGPIFVPAPGHPHPLSHEESPVTMGHEFSGTMSRNRRRGDGPGEGGQRRRRTLFCGRRLRHVPGGQLPPVPADGLHRAVRRRGRAEREDRGGRAVGAPIGDIPLDEAALIEPLSVAHHAVARSGVKAGDTALVGGSGPSGC